MNLTMRIACAILAIMYIICAFVIPRFFPGMDAKIVPAGAGEDVDTIKLIKNIVMWIVQLSIAAAALYVILSRKYPDATEKWAYGALGSIITYVIKP
jgi:hypothetical protein